jgi:hypothetical protein
MSHEKPTNLNYVCALHDFHYIHDTGPFIALVTRRVETNSLCLHQTVGGDNIPSMAADINSIVSWKNGEVYLVTA